MSNSAKNCIKRGLSAAFAAIIFIFCVFTLVACDASDALRSSSSEYPLHLLGFSYSEEESVVYGVVGISGSDANLIDCPKASATAQYVDEGPFFYRRDTRLILDPQAIYSAVTGAMTQEDWMHDGLKYKELKIVFRYDTIYKSVTTDGQTVKSGKHYLHSYMLESDESEHTVLISQRTQNTANWYSVLILCMLIVGVAVVAAVLAVKGKIWQRKKRKE